MTGLPDHAKPSLEGAGTTDEIYDLAYRLAAWGLRNGECDKHSAADWVLGHPHEAKLPRGSTERLQSTERHITKGAEEAARKYDPSKHRRRKFDPEPLHELAARVSGSGVKHERYYLGAIALCHRLETYTPAITGPMLAEVVGVSVKCATRVLLEWNRTLGYGFFTGVRYDGIPRHGRVWSVALDWQPTDGKHETGCPRGKRCNCRKKGYLSLQAEQIDNPKRDTFEEWVSALKPRTSLTVTEVCRKLTLTRAAATELLRSHQGGLLDDETHPGSGTQGRTWFVASPDRTGEASARIEATKAAYADRLATESVCQFPVGLKADERPCGAIAPAGQLRCPEHHDPYEGSDYDPEAPPSWAGHEPVWSDPVLPSYAD